MIDGGFSLISDTNILTSTRAFEKLLNFQHKFNPLTKHDEFTHRIAYVDRHELYLFSAPCSTSKIWNTETGELLAQTMLRASQAVKINGFEVITRNEKVDLKSNGRERTLLSRYGIKVWI